MDFDSGRRTFITSATLAPRRKPRSLYSSSESTLSSVGSATIVPAASDPSGCGRGGMGIGKAPLRTAVSSQFTPAYSTFIDDCQPQLNGGSWRESRRAFTRISLGCGLGTGSSRSSMTSRPPVLEIPTARILEGRYVVLISVYAVYRVEGVVC